MTGWFIANLAWASVLMLAVLILRRPVARLFGAGPAYALWLLPPLRLILPPLPAWRVEMPALASAETMVVWAADTAAPLADGDGGGSWGSILLALWALGALAFVVWQWLAYRGFLTRLSLSARSLGAHRGLPLIESGAVSGPLALGLLDRRIVVPLDFAARYSAEEQGLALDHEAIHHRRGDIWWNYAALAILALNWFNPLAWLAFRAFRADQELACDAAVAGGASAETRLDYANAMIKSASPRGLIAACPLNHADQLKRRLKMMNMHKRSLLRTIGGAGAVSLLAGLGAATAAAGTAHPHPEGTQERRETRVIVRDLREGPAGARGDGERVERRTERIVVRTDRDGAETADRHGVDADGRVLLPADCDDGEVSRIEDGTESERTRIVLCNRGDASPAERVGQLERVRERLASEDHLSAGSRDRVLAALDREIARLRGAQ